MKKTFFRKTLMVSAVIASAVFATDYSYADQSCSNRTLKGSYIGGNTSNVISSIHMFYFDGKGKISSRTTTTTVAFPTSEANYNIDSKCHGTTMNSAGTATLVFEASPDGDRFVGINQDLSPPVDVVSGPVYGVFVSDNDLVH